jgi:hypothetical protein
MTQISKNDRNSCQHYFVCMHAQSASVHRSGLLCVALHMIQQVINSNRASARKRVSDSVVHYKTHAPYWKSGAERLREQL